MKRTFGWASLAIVIAFTAFQSGMMAQDKVDRRDKKGDKTVSVNGKIVEESPAGVKLKIQPGNRDELISPNDVVRVSYGELHANVQFAVSKLGDAETRRDFPALLKGLEGVQALPEYKSAPAPAKRYFDYRIVMLRAITAETEETLKEAAKGLGSFVTTHKESWQYPIVAKQLARLQVDLGDFPGAGKTLDDLEKSNIAPEMKLEATMGLIDVAFQAEKFEDAKKRIETLVKDAKTPAALKDRLAVYQLGLEGASAADEAAARATIKKIEDMISKSADPVLRALAYNVMGDCFMAKGLKRDAMWSYLWVDVVFNSDRGEHVKALGRLVKLYTAENDEEKARMYKEKLNRSR